MVKVGRVYMLMRTKYIRVHQAIDVATCFGNVHWSLGVTSVVSIATDRRIVRQETLCDRECCCSSVL